MKKSHFYYVVSMIALAFALLGSCQKEDRVSLLEEQKRYKFTLTEAKEFFYLEATDLQLPSQTIGKVKSGLPDLNDITTIDWKNADVKDYTNYLSYEVPLHNSRHTHAVMLQKIGVDSVLCENADVRYSLLLQRAKSKDTTRMLVSTIISLAKDRKRVDKLQSDRFHGNRRGFTGYVMVSTLDGEVESIYSYDKGRREYYSKYTISTNVDSMRNNSGGFSFVVMGGGGDGGYGYSEQGHCRMCGKYGLLYQPDWYCLTCTTHELPGPVVKPGDGGGDSHVCDKCGEIPCVCCHCGGGCHCDCGYSCINCSGSEDPFACPYCGEINCPRDCQRGNGGGGETPETPEPPNDPKDTLIVSDILSMVGYDLQSAKDMIDPIIGLLASGSNTSKIVDYCSNIRVQMQFEKKLSMSATYSTSITTISGNISSITIYYNIAGAEPAPILHEFTHIWYKSEYPGVSLTENMNSEIISLLSELVSTIDFPDGIYSTVSGVNYKDREYLEEFYNNPREDMIDRIVEIVVQRKPDVYGSFILDRSTILHQIANFKSLINQ